MRTFIAYRFTGENPKLLEPLLTSICNAFKVKGINAYCTLFDEQEFRNKSYNAKQIMDHAFGVINSSDFLFVLQTSENKSEGMLMEVGYCIAKKIPIIVAAKNEIKNTYIPDIASVRMPWSNIEDLLEEIRNYEFNGIHHLVP